ncbi:WcbI family polysaccharide biosynthesis putative acetyltransferase [Asticcacaulis excentricus]|uniref:Polysaccharide biosynthesis enzyme WcbI domain-containing protein n=1 Tax=Asticcacaulis excentricus (strain ATCC 15261 / DSM 4724 / KCTC 12464 / NCIMB 9791 / VKM B-1370 / CB 48) TaxID=573065 RepID=E8RMP1_ASTEC|nr:WcbI family polysaccharide biosynthesis putative acetyltransferase [Asticcacaulis excentricus]ADU13922.1 hypothetical protein Astex_2267 [Asticcacaulis excentricus CB 48]
MSRKIRVSGACQTGGIIDSLKIMLPHDDVGHLPTPGVSPDDAFDEEIRTVDIWVTALPDYASEDHLSALNPRLQVLRWPQLYFPAFHPDIVIPSSGSHVITSMGCVYNSTLALWSWKEGVPVNKAIRLFEKDTLAALGYLDEWDNSAARMKNDFDACALDFSTFFLAVKRQGVFMHSNLHAKLSPIVHISRQLAMKMGAKSADVYEPIEDFLADPLIFDAVWPVYPAIADNLGVPGCFRWKSRERHASDLRTYLEISYADYDAQPIEKDNIHTGRFNPAFDALLTRQLEAAA